MTGSLEWLGHRDLCSIQWSDYCDCMPGSDCSVPHDALPGDRPCSDDNCPVHAEREPECDCLPPYADCPHPPPGPRPKMPCGCDGAAARHDCQPKPTLVTSEALMFAEKAGIPWLEERPYEQTLSDGDGDLG